MLLEYDMSQPVENVDAISTDEDDVDDDDDDDEDFNDEDDNRLIAYPLNIPNPLSLGHSRRYTAW